MINKLFIFSDSFGAYPPGDSIDNYWMTLLAKHFKCQLYIGGGIGSSQDYCFSKIADNRDFITQDDQIIVLLTEPSRFWFYEPIPEISNVNVINIDQQLPPGFGTAAINYFSYLYRPQLGDMWEENRLAWLNNLSRIQQWRKPIIISCFRNLEYDMKQFDFLDIVEGNLLNVSHAEFTDSTIEKSLIKINDDFETLDTNTIFFGMDARGCHLCFSNHKILKNKIVNLITNNEKINLNLDFLSDFLSEETVNDSNFARKEFSSIMYTKFLESKKEFLSKKHTNYIDVVSTYFKKIKG
ncbi:MAG: hypothetical protein RLZZ196_112 [Bacteroidota bacterium]|jgi:regulator of replication initiation timing